MEKKISELKEHLYSQFSSSLTLEELSCLKTEYLGKEGKITLLSQGMKDLTPQERPVIGKELHQLRVFFTEEFDKKLTAIEEARDRLAYNSLDPTLPGRGQNQGALHPLTILTERIISIFRKMGFSLVQGPEIETSWYCFDALNTPVHHPARDEQDTFYLPDGRLLRTQTSTVQIRAMERMAPPLRIIAPGAAYRRDEVDATHLAQFTQMEVLCVGKNQQLSELKSVAEFFFQELLGKGTLCHFRPHFFPFTEPSFEIDVKLKIGGEERFLELAGCGMVDPEVFKAVCERRGDDLYHPDSVTGFAFGFGLERLVMLLTGLSDIRLLTENDLRFLSQFIHL